MIDTDLAACWQLHRAGRFAEAARYYDAVISRNPDHADALHLFGVLHHQCGNFARAVELIGRAVALRPEAAAFHANLAEAHRALGQHQQAIDCCQVALRLQPEYPEAANNLGLALHASGRFGEAVDQFRAALEMRADFAVAQNNLGSSLRELGQADEALAAYQAAVDLDHELAAARSNLGQFLVDVGQAEQALPHCQEAVRLQPALPASHNNLGNAYRALERWAEAHAAYDEAVRLAPDLAPVHANRGLAFFLAGKQADAFPCFRRAVELAPEDAEMWRYLATAYTSDDDHAAALPCWERVVSLEPELAQGHNDLGWALQAEGRHVEAVACYRRAEELLPNHVEALLNQGALHEASGEFAQAEACYRKACATASGAPGPLACLATLLRGRLPDADMEAIQTMRSDPRLAGLPSPHSALLFGLAQVLDAKSDYAEAAACLAQANALALQHNRKTGRHYDPVEHSRFVDRLIDNFSREFFSRLAGTGDDMRLPVFVFGLPRSGTTLVEQVLASHAKVHGAGELRLARPTFEGIPTVLGREDDMQVLRDLNPGHVQTLSRRFRAGLDTVLGRDCPEVAPERVVDKMPDNYLYLGLLALLFPRATFIHVRRDLRDVAVSCWMTNFRGIRWTNDPAHLAGRFREYVRVMAHWQTVLPAPVHEVVYERLVDDFEPEARKLIAACGLDWEPACLQFHETKRQVRTASVTQVRKPLYRQALARWKHYETPLAELFAQLPVS